VHVTKALLTLALDRGQLYVWPLHSRGKNRRQSCNRCLDGTQSLSAWSEEENHLFPLPGIEPRCITVCTLPTTTHCEVEDQKSAEAGCTASHSQ